MENQTQSASHEAAVQKHVLIIEDDDITRKLLVIEFKRRGHTVLEYADAATAMRLIEKDKPRIDAGVVDLMNLGYGGNLGDYLRKLPEYRAAMIIFYTALTQDQFNTKILTPPNTFYVHKVPGSIKTLIARVEGSI